MGLNTNLTIDNSDTKMSLENKADFLCKEIVVIRGKDHTIFRNNVTNDLRNAL